MSATIAVTVLRSKSGLRTSSSSDRWPLDHEATDSTLILTIDSGVSVGVINLIFSARISKTQDTDALSMRSKDHAYVQSFVWVFTGFFRATLNIYFLSPSTKKECWWRGHGRCYKKQIVSIFLCLGTRSSQTRGGHVTEVNDPTLQISLHEGILLKFQNNGGHAIV